MRPTTKIILVALAAGVLGVLASLMLNGSGPLWRTDIGQRVLQGLLTTTAPEPPVGVRVARRGEAVPALPLPDLDGGAITIPADFSGRRVLVNVWASWCGPCIKEMPALDRYAGKQAVNGVQVVGIALDDPVAVRAFLQRIPVRYRILTDAPGPADAGIRLGNPKGVLPYSVLIAADGRLLKQRIGPFAEGEIEGWARD